MYHKISNDIKQEYYQTNYPNNGQRFVAWYLRNIHNLDLIEAKDCITDGPGDKQIDAVYIDNQSCCIYIIQGKFCSGEKIDSEPLREVLSSWTMIKNLDKLQESANEKLAGKINEIAVAIEEDDYDICFELITTATLTDAAQSDLERFQSELAENQTLNATLVLVDNPTLRTRYEESVNSFRPCINHSFEIDPDKAVNLVLGGTSVVLAAISLKECLKIPGIKDGSLFKKNVRQSLGKNTVNKGIARTLKDDAQNFFFYHNGITAICTELKINNNHLIVRDLNVVNGCQSLTTIYNSSQTVRKSDDGYIMFRFYEIIDPLRADKISTSTNSQSAVKARDLRSNDKSVLMMKKAFEQKYPDGYFVTKRGESVDSARYNSAHVVYLSDLGKYLIAWHSQRPTISYSETKIFDKYFNQLFKKDYSPEDMLALTQIFKQLYDLWKQDDNPLQLEESLLAMKSYAPYHHLYTISILICELNKLPDNNVPSPHLVFEKLNNCGFSEEIIKLAGSCLNTAFKNANSNVVDNGKIFSPQNWIKNKSSLTDIKNAVRSLLSVYQVSLCDKYKLYVKTFKLNSTDFESRWTAD